MMTAVRSVAGGVLPWVALHCAPGSIASDCTSTVLPAAIMLEPPGGLGSRHSPGMRPMVTGGAAALLIVTLIATLLRLQICCNRRFEEYCGRPGSDAGACVGVLPAHTPLWVNSVPISPLIFCIE